MIDFDDKKGDIELTQFNSPSPKQASIEEQINPITLQPVLSATMAPIEEVEVSVGNIEPKK